MPRSKRLEIPGAIYHVIVRGIEGREIFLHDFDREEFLRRLEKALKETGHKCYAWALMPNHIHLLITTGTNSLSDMMRKVLTGYAIYFNRKYKRSGYLYQNRYKSILCQEDVYFLELIRYIHLNPLIGGVVKSLEELENYWWTGHSVLIGKRERLWQTADDVLIRFSEQKDDAIQKYKEYIFSGKNMGKRNDLIGGGLKRSEGIWKNAKGEPINHKRADERILGDSCFVEKVLKAADEKLEKEVALKNAGWNLDRLVDDVCSKMEITRDDLKKKGRRNKISRAKGLIAYLGCKELGAKRTEIARLFGTSKQSIGKVIEFGQAEAKASNYNLLN
ncbi:MAG: transposase [Elusimicrobia bacterium]|nr:transposase [Elusimicrobiota bacterium]